MDNDLQLLTNPSKIYSRSQLLKDRKLLPESPGIYAWFFKEIPPKVPTTGCVVKDGLVLLYVGISPSNPGASKVSSKRDLKKRIMEHYSGNAEASTLRLTLGCLLSDGLNIELRRVGSGRRMTFTKAGETKLSDWMSHNAYVTWVEHPTPWQVEEEAIKRFVLPLNLQENESNDFSGTLSGIRSEMRSKARNMPIILY